jgi:predicted alpha/beta-fold hydrolase
MPAGRIVPSSFKPAWWLPGPHSQTLWPYLFRRRHHTTYNNQRLELPDGDFVDLCLTPGISGPIVAIFHGLEGDIHSPYAAAIMATLHNRGWRGVFMHFRGCSGIPNRLDRSYHSGDTGDIRFLIDVLSERHPGTPLAVIGYSLGGNAVLKYLGENGSHTTIKAAVAVSVPYVLQDSATRLSRGFSRLYQRRLVRSLHAKLRNKFAERQPPFDMGNPRSLDTFYKFDDAITAPLHGFRNADDYYMRSSSRQYLAKIRVPTLLLHARNDPFMTPAVLPSENELSETVTLELSDHGGHVGFTGGMFPWNPVYWLEQRIIAYLNQYL